VLANRIWRYHFGQGLVATPDNLGQSGARPVDPGLLDWLASELIRSGWSLKHLNRLIVTSATWKQAGANSKAASRDGASSQGDDYWSFIREARRLDAESLRDAMLTVSGEIDLTSGGAYVPTKTDKQGQVIIDEKQPGAHRRSLYLQQRRTSPVGIISTFDGPAHNPVCVQRVSSTVALQSLALLNSEFIRVRARAFAKRVLKSAELPGKSTVISGTKSSPGDSTHALKTAFDLAYGRAPTREELSAAETFLREQNAAYKNKPHATEQVWTDLCQMLLASNAFLYVD
jgi:hypothetical protein